MAAKMKKPEMINQQVGWCPGCGHGIIQRLIAECCEELGNGGKDHSGRGYCLCILVY